jgi:hypothetical protein
VPAPADKTGPTTSPGRLSSTALNSGNTLTAALALDVHPRVAMAILRHSKIALTMEIYTQVPDKVTRDALKRLSDQLDQAHGAMPDEADE